MKRAYFQIARRRFGTIISCLFLSIACLLSSGSAAAQKAAAKSDVAPAASAATTEDNPAERDAFAAMFNETDQRRRRDMAERFLADYPQSWRLAPVYEIASKSSYALGDLRAALEFGAKSIRILPENPFLLLPLADAQTRAGMYDAAERSAKDAVWYLDRFDRPTSIDEADWPEVLGTLGGDDTVLVIVDDPEKRSMIMQRFEDMRSGS